MFCLNCGKPLPKDSHFCPACGHTAEGEPADAPASNSAPRAAAARGPDVISDSPVQGGKPGVWARLKAMKTWKKVVLGVVVFIVGVVWLALAATGGLIKPVERHFAALRGGDAVGAYSELSIAARQEMSLDAFKAMVEGSPALAHVTKESFTSRTVTNGQGQLEGALDLDNGGKLPIEIRLVKENGQWKILGYRLNPVKKLD